MDEKNSNLNQTKHFYQIHERKIKQCLTFATKCISSVDAFYSNNKNKHRAVAYANLALTVRNHYKECFTPKSFWHKYAKPEEWERLENSEWAEPLIIQYLEKIFKNRIIEHKDEKLAFCILDDYIVGWSTNGKSLIFFILRIRIIFD